MKKFTTIAEYIASAPKESQKKLREMRAIVKACAPGATETIKYGMPAFVGKRILVIFGGFKHHIGLYPTTSAMKAFLKSFSKYKTSTGTIQFPLDKPLPKGVIRKIVKFRVKESLEQDGKWRT